MMGLILAALAASQSAGTAGVETTIPFAGNGGLRDWQRSVGEPNVLYVRDRAEHWYRVSLTGPCGTLESFDTLTYTTDNIGTFDRFSNVGTTRFPDQVCGVTSIRKSAPPPSIRSRGAG